MNEENFTEQDDKTRQPAEEEFSGQGGAAVLTEPPPVEGETADSIGEGAAADPTYEAAEDFVNRADAIEKQIADQREQDRRLLEALDKALERRNRAAGEETKRPLTKTERAAATVTKKGVGFVSLGLILIFMGVVMIMTLTAPTPNYALPIKLSPVCAILIGAEIIITQAVTRGRTKISFTSLALSVLLTAGCIILCLKLGGDYKEEVVEYNNRTIAGEIYDRSYEHLKGVADIVSVDVEVDLNPDGTGKTTGIEALSTSDIVNVNIVLGGVYYTPRSFVSDCRKIVNSYAQMEINVTNFRFKNESRLRAYSLDIEGRYAQDMDEQRLLELVDFVYIDDYNYIEDMDDYVEDENSGDSSEG